MAKCNSKKFHARGVIKARLGGLSHFIGSPIEEKGIRLKFWKDGVTASNPFSRDPCGNPFFQRMKVLPEKQKFSLTDFSLIMATVIWGSDYPFAKIAMQEISPLSFSAARTLLATAALFPFFLIQESSWKVSRRDFLYLILLACFGTFLNRICWSVGLSLSTASNAALLMTTSPIFVLITSVLLFRSSVTWRATAGIVVAFVGVFLVIRGDLKGWDWRSTYFLGDLILLGAAVSWALFTALAKFLLKDYSSLKVTAYVMAIGSILFRSLFAERKTRGLERNFRSRLVQRFLCGVVGKLPGLFFMDEGNSEHRAPQDHSLFVSHAHNGDCLFRSSPGRNGYGNPDLGRSRRFCRDLFGPIRVGISLSTPSLFKGRPGHCEDLG